MSIIKNIYSRQIFDYRGIPTVEGDVVTTEGASIGQYEAVVFGDRRMDYFGKGGAFKAIGYIAGIL